MPRTGILDQRARIAAKERSRQEDAEALRQGRVTPAELAAANGAFSALRGYGFRIAAVGAEEIRALREREGRGKA